jgi:protein-disulfide isomerase
MLDLDAKGAPALETEMCFARGVSRGAVLALVLAAGCGGGPAVSDETIGQRVIEYFGKAVTTPGVTFTMTKIEPAEVPGWRKGHLEAALGEQKQDVPFYVSDDGRYLFRSDAIDLTVDPFVALAQKMKIDGEPSRGPADAKVTVVEYSDFECPYCAQAWETFEKEVFPQYKDKVRFVFKQMPLTQIHPWAEDAAVATECALQQGNDQFWTLYDGLFAQQRQITKENLPAKVEEIATAGGLDVPTLKDCLAGRKTIDAVKADQAEAASVGVNGTPTFFVNGRRIQGGQSAADFKQAIDKALAGSTS